MQISYFLEYQADLRVTATSLYSDSTWRWSGWNEAKSVCESSKVFSELMMNSLQSETSRLTPQQSSIPSLTLTTLSRCKTPVRLNVFVFGLMTNDICLQFYLQNRFTTKQADDKQREMEEEHMRLWSEADLPSEVIL